MSDSGKDYDYGNEEAATWWRIHPGAVLDASNRFIVSGETSEFDFDRAPRFDYFPPSFRTFHETHIRSIVNLIHTPLEISPRERYELIAPHLVCVIEALYSFEEIEFMREEIQSDLRAMLTSLDGLTRNASFNQCFYGREVENPKSCGDMARRA